MAHTKNSRKIYLNRNSEIIRHNYTSPYNYNQNKSKDLVRKMSN